MRTLELATVRFGGTKDFTAGRLYADGNFICHTLEDEVREIDGRPVSEWKVQGRTAIPRGRYRVILTRSPRFKRILPELLNVPGYTGIRVHRGNTADHTEGCILVGMPDGNERDSWLGNSTPAEGLVIKIIGEAINSGRTVWWTIV